VSARLSAFATAAALILGAAPDAAAHQLNVFASTDCETVLVEAKFSNGRNPLMGTVTVHDGNETLLMTGDLTADGTLSIPLADLDTTTGLMITVKAGDHDDYWIMTPDDIARKCQS